MAGTLLIVDDEQPVRRMLGQLLSDAGYAVVDADSAEQALERAQVALFDAVITDLRMPGRDGLSLAEALLAEDPDRPVLMMTAYADVENAQQALKIGIYDYFTKPFDVSDVLAGVHRALVHRRLVLANRAHERRLEQRVAERTRQLEQKLRELEARDTLLRRLLSMQPPEKTLGLAADLAAGLCGCQAAALYVVTGDEPPVLRAAFGFAAAGSASVGKKLQELNLTADAAIQKALTQAGRQDGPVVVQSPGPVRKAMGTHSAAVFALRRGGRLLGLLEVDRQEGTHPVTEEDLKPLESFLPHVAMAVADCALQDNVAGWVGDVDAMLDAADEWKDQA